MKFTFGFHRCKRCGKIYRPSKIQYVTLYGKEYEKSGYWCIQCMLQYISESLLEIIQRINEKK